MIKHLKTFKFSKDKNGYHLKKEQKISPKKITYETDDDYISIDEIYKKLKLQKAEDKTQNPIYQINDFQKPVVPINMDTFCIHQYNYNDNRNKIHKELKKNLISMLKKNYLMNHIILHGLSGSGKYTLAMSMMHHICGDNIHKRLIKSQTIDKKTIKYIENNYYLEILINNYVLNDDKTLTHFIKNNARNEGSGLCQFIILKHFDELTDRCQKSIFHIMEKLTNIRFIITTKHLSKINSNIKSNSCLIRVPRPDSKLLAKYLNRIAKDNNMKISHGQIEHTVRTSECNISQSLTTMELCCLNKDSIYIKQKDPHLKYIADILQLSTGPCIENIREIRRLVSKLVITTYDVSEVYRTCTKLFLNSKYDNIIKQQVIEIANKYSQLNNTTHDTIFIMEAFFLHVMRIVSNEPVKKSYSLQKLPQKT